MAADDLTRRDDDTVWGSVRRHALLVVLSTALLAGIGLGLGAARAPTHSAEAIVSVGRLDVSNAGGLAGFSLATQTLAQSYARAIVADPVEAEVARRTKLPEDEVKERLSATAIPETSVIKVTATSDDERSALLYANTASEALITYVAELNRNNPDSDRLYEQFREASSRFNRARSAVRAAERAIRTSPTSESRSALAAARVRADAAELRRETVRSAYATSQQAQASTSLLQVLSAANETTTDRSSTAQLLVLAGALGGFALGAALALLRQRRLRRSRS